MAQVLGIGGVFFKAADLPALRDWYARVLGFNVTKWGGAVFDPPQRGRTVWTPFAQDTTHFAPSDREFMINLMVDDLDGVLARVTEAGVPILGREDMDQFGRFAWIMDPAGIKLELWQPA
jgi:catechol 2,3-dioxygenase-like lactoylglutathione lyase family enzyme